MVAPIDTPDYVPNLTGAQTPLPFNVVAPGSMWIPPMAFTGGAIVIHVPGTIVMQVAVSFGGTAPNLTQSFTNGTHKVQLAEAAAPFVSGVLYTVHMMVEAGDHWQAFFDQTVTIERCDLRFVQDAP